MVRRTRDFAYSTERISSGQFLFYRYPDAYFAYRNVYVRSHLDEERTVEDLQLPNDAYMRGRIAREISRGRRQVRADQIRILKPPMTQWELEPDVFLCPQCHRVYGLRELEQADIRDFRCPRDKSPLQQISLVFVHRCGNLVPVEIPRGDYYRCKKCGKAMKALDYVREKLSRSQWFCPDHPDQQQDLQQMCWDCYNAYLEEHPGDKRGAFNAGRMSLLPAGKATYGQTLTTIAVEQPTNWEEMLARWEVDSAELTVTPDEDTQSELQQLAFLLKDRAEELPKTVPMGRKLGLKVYYISDLPVLTLLYGYTIGGRRGKFVGYLSTEGDLFYDAYGGMLYSEALLIELDPQKVTLWLETNGFSVSGDPRIWLSCNRCNEEGEYPIVTKVHGVLHALSHSLMRKSELTAGLSRFSLKEIFFPTALSFVLYSQGGNELGYIRTTVESEGILRWFNALWNAPKRCVNDPLCFQNQASCYACLIVPERNCATFNENLSRFYLNVPASYRGRAQEEFGVSYGYWDNF
jgi:hypothetical protein